MSVLRKLAHVLTLGGGLACALLAVLDQQSPALAALGVAAVGLAGTQYFQMVELGRIDRALAASTRQGKERGKALRVLARRSTRQHERTDRQLGSVLRSTANLTRELETLPSDVVNLDRMQERLLPGAIGPRLGRWAATTTTIQLLVDLVEQELREGRTPVALECGSGGSTVFLAGTVRQAGKGRVIALEHSSDFAEKTREDLRRLGLDTFARVVDAPLTPLPGDDEGRLWYDVEALADVSEVSILFVDGPPGTTWSHARIPALEQVAPRLVDGAWVVLDDTTRREEREIVADWTSRDYAGRRLHKVAVVGRATLMRLERS